jgi:hypothetical protein
VSREHNGGAPGGLDKAAFRVKSTALVAHLVRWQRAAPLAIEFAFRNESAGFKMRGKIKCGWFPPFNQR